MANYLENATGFQVIDPASGNVIGGGSFNNPGSYQPFAGFPENPMPTLQLPTGYLSQFGIGVSNPPNSPAPPNLVRSSGNAGGFTTVSATNAPTDARGAPSNPDLGATVSGGVGPVTGSIADYFARAVIIILGFIFVAVGLNMFKPGIVPDPRKLVKR
jgi:hypothetical protein